MRRLLTAAVALVALLPAPAALAKPKVAGNAVSVTVEGEEDVQKAYALADEFCGKHGRIARRTGGSGYSYIFDCVEKP